MFRQRSWGVSFSVAAIWRADAATLACVSGTILGVTFKPGSPTPSANYDVVLNDQLGSDVLAGQGANRSASAAERVCPGQAFLDGTTTSVAPISVNDVLSLSVTNAGDSKAGSLAIYMR